MPNTHTIQFIGGPADGWKLELYKPEYAEEVEFETDEATHVYKFNGVNYLHVQWAVCKGK